MKFSTGIILSALAFNAFAATPTNISPGPLLDHAGASGGRSRSGRGGDRSRSSSGSRSPSRSRRLPDLITLNALVVRVYDEHKPIWTEDRRKEVLAFGQKPSVAAGNKMPLQKLLEEVVSKMPVGEKSRMKVGFVEKLESIITRSRDYAKSHRKSTPSNSRAISSGTNKYGVRSEKGIDNAQIGLIISILS
ncbi:hypothetical protein BASA62_007001 [Batrachochytrium salamandrivorans]|nr:hypothetical protein BASA62_007001 [Batrachochytrium salamandrivorans]